MKVRTRFLANDVPVETELWPGSPALDFIRGELGLVGTKEGCREGDCGACAVLVGELVASSESGAVLAGERVASSARYGARPSCLLALGELEGRHLVTIEGLRGAGEGLTPVMRAILEANGSQCGFCSPGFVISLTAFLLAGPPYTEEAAFAALEGNLCRCTGYGALRRAAAALVRDFSGLPAGYLERLEALTAAAVVPPSLLAFARGELLPALPPAEAAAAAPGSAPPLVIGGGSDLYVRSPHPAPRDEPPLLLRRRPAFTGIRRSGGLLELGAALSWREFFASPELRAAVPGIERFEAELASPLVREQATLGGNAANASPIADAAAMLIALGAKVRITRLEGGPVLRELPLEELFLGYKKLALAPGEALASFAIDAASPRLFSFEKVAKRSRLDIASANSAACLSLEGGRIAKARIAAGGVAPVPLLLREASAFLEGRLPDAATAREAARIAASEASPISDVRGSAEYRLTLLKRLVLAHFERLFPGRGIAEEALA
ncbi:MAG TPA: FAD binding domain-containing protein [Spirochaetia bacterium]|nr:FAD binding domain-containing protein [Spirochaetia bacterium]HRZ63466.1 FAD binding domain-containing protein [Spirochaetia bacterium]